VDVAKASDAFVRLVTVRFSGKFFSKLPNQDRLVNSGVVSGMKAASSYAVGTVNKWEEEREKRESNGAIN